MAQGAASAMKADDTDAVWEMNQNRDRNTLGACGQVAARRLCFRVFS